eukprot:1676143-Rhodomonas_salina.2
MPVQTAATRPHSLSLLLSLLLGLLLPPPPSSSSLSPASAREEEGGGGGEEGGWGWDVSSTAAGRPAYAATRCVRYWASVGCGTELRCGTEQAMVLGSMCSTGLAYGARQCVRY